MIYISVSIQLVADGLDPSPVRIESLRLSNSKQYFLCLRSGRVDHDYFQWRSGVWNESILNISKAV